MRIIITDVYDLRHNYGVQGLVLPLVEKINDLTGAEFIMPVQSAYFTAGNIEFAGKRGIKLIAYWKYSFLIDLFHPLVRSPRSLFSKFFKAITGDRGRGPISLYHELVQEIEGSDKIIDVAGIEFIGNSGVKKKWGELLFGRMFQKISERSGRQYFKYTKSYGPFEGFLFRAVSMKLLERLPFIFIRGRNNLEEIRKLNLKTPLYLFPDVSLVLKPAENEQADNYLRAAGADISLPVIGISPSRVLSKINTPGQENCVGPNHLVLVKNIITEYTGRGFQVMIIPHAIDKTDKNKCDRELAKELMEELNNERLFILPDDLSYSEVRAVIGKLSFYITGRYHSVASALYMETPVVSLSWHIKYTDIMSEFLDDFLVVDSRNTSVQDALGLIRKYHSDMKWFDREKIRYNRERIEKEVERSVKMIVEFKHHAH